MKILIFIILIVTLIDCGDKNFEKKDLPIAKPGKSTVTIEKQLLDYPLIKDTGIFITELRKTFNISVDESPEQNKNELITAFKKVEIFGSDQDYFFIEYDYKVGCMAAYPWKYQLLVTTDGKLVKLLSGIRYEFIEVFPSQKRFLLLTISTAKGNGGHELYKFTSDSLENIYEGDIMTYDAHEDNFVNEPRELVVSTSDYNNDGFYDLAFRGNVVLIQGKKTDGVWFDNEITNGKEVIYSVDYPFKKIPVEYVFLYDTKSGHFKTTEDYLKKYRLDE